MEEGGKGKDVAPGKFQKKFCTHSNLCLQIDLLLNTTVLKVILLKEAFIFSYVLLDFYQ